MDELTIENQEKTKLEQMMGFWHQDQDNLLLVCQIFDILIQDKRYEQGEAFFDRQSETVRSDLIVCYKLCLLLLGQDKLDEAERHLETIFAKIPSQIEVAFHLAYVRYMKNEPGRAYEILAGFIERWQDLPNLLLLAARCLKLLYRPHSAVDLVKTYLHKFKNDETALTLLCTLYCDAGHFEASYAIAHQVLENSDESIEAMVSGASAAIALGKLNMAQQWLQQAVTLEPASLVVWRELGALHLAKVELGDAQDCFARAISIDEQDLPSNYLKGLAQMLEDQYENALACFKFVLSVDEHHADSYGGSAICLLSLGVDTDMVENLETCLAINPENPLGLIAQSMYLKKQGKDDLAQTVLEEALPKEVLEEQMPYIRFFYDKHLQSVEQVH